MTDTQRNQDEGTRKWYHVKGPAKWQKSISAIYLLKSLDEHLV